MIIFGYIKIFDETIEKTPKYDIIITPKDVAERLEDYQPMKPKYKEYLLADMKANPGKIKMSYTGPGGSGHVQGLIMEKLGYVPALTAYSSGADCYRSWRCRR